MLRALLFFVLLLLAQAESLRNNYHHTQQHQQQEHKYTASLEALQHDLNQLLPQLLIDSEEQPPPEIVDVPPEIRAQWTTMQAILDVYFRYKRPASTLDPLSPLFNLASARDWRSHLKTLLQSAAADSIQSRLVNFERDLIEGRLATAQAAMESCEAVSRTFMAVYEASSTFQGAINSLSGGIASGVSAFATLQEGSENFDTPDFVSVKKYSSLTQAVLTADPEHSTSSKSSKADRLSNVGSSAVRVVGDTTYAVLSFGMGPLIGFLSGKILEVIELAWIKDKQTAACFLGLFGAVSEGLGYGSSVAAQGVQYRVTESSELLSNVGHFTDLLSHAKHESDVGGIGGGVISSEDIYAVLEDDFKVLSRAKNFAQVVREPITGISETIRDYVAGGNEFEKAAKYAGTSLVMFLKTFYWKVYFQAVTEGTIPMENAGLLKSVVVTGSLEYPTLYSRFGLVHDYAKDGAFNRHYGCRRPNNTPQGYCILYCKADNNSNKDLRAAGNWCFTKNPARMSEGIIECRSHEDCYSATAPFWRAFADIPCGSTCGKDNHEIFETE